MFRLTALCFFVRWLLGQLKYRITYQDGCFVRTMFFYYRVQKVFNYKQQRVTEFKKEKVFAFACFCCTDRCRAPAIIFEIEYVFFLRCHILGEPTPNHRTKRPIRIFKSILKKLWRFEKTWTLLSGSIIRVWLATEYAVNDVKQFQ